MSIAFTLGMSNVKVIQPKLFPKVKAVWQLINIHEIPLYKGDSGQRSLRSNLVFELSSCLDVVKEERDWEKEAPSVTERC